MRHQFKAFIFDLDGTLVDSAAIVELVMRRWCRENEIEYALLEDSSRSSRTEDTVRSVAPHLDCKSEAEKIEAIEREELKNLKEIRGASAFLERLPNRQWALATSSDSLTAIAKLQATGMPIPRVLIGGDQVDYGKPHPEAYLSAATGLRLSAEDCLAFEDSDTGISSAVAAGCSVMVVGTRRITSSPQIIGSIVDFEEIDFVVGECSSLTLTALSRQNKTRLDKG
ncbi:MAG: HAD-IA family hydrolase [Verrucomicrobiales bacterium]|nr:HAD-IA family hydrolase [Verrucomicrobiales bacterium]